MAAPISEVKGMEIKFTKKLSDYDCVVMFDLATRSTGVCVWDVKTSRPLYTENIVTTGKTGNRADELLHALDDFFVRFFRKYDANTKVLVHRELCPIQQGRFTTAKTLISLGKSHAVLDIYLAEHGYDYYDLAGVSPSTTHAHFRHLMGLDSRAKVEKEDVRKYLVSEYGIDPDLGLDESDAIFLAKTFVERFWNAELDEECREVKRHMKTLKSPKAIEAQRERIDFLSGLKV